MAQIAEKVIENEIVLGKEHIPSNFYFTKKINLFFEILSLFYKKSKKVQKSATRSARIAKVPFIKSA